MKHLLKTERLTLRPINKTDVKIAEDIFTDPFVRKFLFDDEILEKNQIEEFIETSEETFREKNYGLWLIFSDDSETAIGFTGLWHFFDEDQPQILYALLPKFTAKGFASEAAQKVIEYSFSQLNFKYLEANCDAPNINSHRVAENLGMKKIKQAEINGLPTVFFRLEK